MISSSESCNAREGEREGGGRSARPSPRREDRGGQINAPTRVETASRASAPAHPWFVRRALASVYPSFARARSLAWSEGMRGCGARPEVRRRRRNEDDADRRNRRQQSCTRKKRLCLLEPSRPPKTSPLLARQNRGCGEVDTASASGAEDPEFESRHPHFFFFCLRDVANDVLFPMSHFARRTAKCGGGGGRRRARGCAGVLKLGKFSPIAKISQIADRNRPWFRRSSSIKRPDQNRRPSRR